MKRIRKVKIILGSHYEYFGITFVFIWGCRQLFENAHFILHVINSLTFLSAFKRAVRSLVALDTELTAANNLTAYGNFHFAANNLPHLTVWTFPDLLMASAS